MRKVDPTATPDPRHVFAGYGLLLVSLVASYWLGAPPKDAAPPKPERRPPHRAPAWGASMHAPDGIAWSTAKFRGGE